MLIEGQIIETSSGNLYEVISVNESRAHIKSLTKKENSFHTAFGQQISFSSGGSELDISPNSEVKIINQPNYKES